MTFPLVDVLLTIPLLIRNKIRRKYTATSGIPLVADFFLHYLNFFGRISLIRNSEFELYSL